MNFKAVALSAAAVTALVTPAPAHHSFAMFDADRTVTLQGTVKEFEWTNPHSWLHIMVRDEATGQQSVWALELSSPARLKRMGMSGDVSSAQGRGARRTVPPGGAAGRQADHPRQCGRRERAVAGTRAARPSPHGTAHTPSPRRGKGVKRCARLTEMRAASPPVANRSGSGIGLRSARELAVEFAGERPCGRDGDLGAGGGEE